MGKISDAVLEFLGQLLKSLVEKHQTTPELTQSVVPVTQPPAPAQIDRKVTFIQSPNFSSRNGDSIKAIIIHDTESSNLQSAISWFQSKDSQVSAHYVIDKNGDIYQMVKDEDKAWHCGVSSLHGKSNVNTFSIGIELVGDSKTEFPKEQYAALAWLVKTLKTKYNVDDSWIVGHKDIALPSGRKTDPQPFDWDLFWKLVREQ